MFHIIPGLMLFFHRCTTACTRYPWHGLENNKPLKMTRNSGLALLGTVICGEWGVWGLWGVTGDSQVDAFL